MNNKLKDKSKKMKDILFSFRKLKRNKLLLYVGIPGLAIGLSVVLLLVCYVRREYSFDKHFATKNRVVRLYNTDVTGNFGSLGICLRKSYDEIPNQIPEVEACAQLFNDAVSKLKIEKTGETFSDMHALYVDDEYFKVFEQKLISGNMSDALKGKNRIVLAKTTALKYFGTVDCVGKQLVMESWGEPNYVVSGVVEDLPDNSHFNFDLLISMETLPLDLFTGMEFQTYYLLKKGSDVAAVSRKIEQANDAIMEPFMKGAEFSIKSETKLLKDVHFFIQSINDVVPTVNLNYVRLVAGIALLVLMISLANFINLYVLHSKTRINEVAMRKSLGATQAKLAWLFLSDTLIMALLSFGISVFLTSVASPYFSKLLNSKVTVSELFSLEGSVALFVILALTVLISGIFPLISLSNNNLALGVKGKTKEVKRKSFATQTALLLQFSITAFLLAAVIIFYSQMQYMKSIPLGFNAENVEYFNTNMRTLLNSMSSIKEEIRNLPFVESVAGSDHRIGGVPSGQRIANYGSDKGFVINEYRTTPGFGEALQLQLVAGNFFTEKSANEIIINEAGIKELGLVDPVGKLVLYKENPVIIKGVVKDFYYTDNSGKKIEPLVITSYTYSEGSLYVRTTQKMSVAEKLQITSILKKFDDTYVLNSQSLNDLYASKFKEEEKTLKMVGTGALLAILLCISGLVALSLLNVNRRTKEIGVRKIIGSNEWQILKMLIFQVLGWIFAASLIGFLVNYWVMHEMLQDFVNRITITPIYYLVSWLVILVVALLAVSWQSWRAATRNPVEALRYE